MTNYPFDMGPYSWPITTQNPEAQLWFDRGLIWTYGFHSEEAHRCFSEALKADPECAMAWWGIAYASGPYYNKPWEWFEENERIDALNQCYSAIQKAISLQSHASPLEQVLINALSVRYPHARFKTEGDYKQWNDEYANAMRQVYDNFSDCPDTCALTAEALMTRTAWQLWDNRTGKVMPDADTLEAIEIIEHGLKISSESHPGLLHLHIHVLEMSHRPQDAVSSANKLRDYPSASGHLRHMPTHIDALVGDNHQSVITNFDAEKLDNAYRHHRDAGEFHDISCAHNIQMGMQAAMLMGHEANTQRCIRSIRNILTEDVIRVDHTYLSQALEAYYPAHIHALVRFGRWQECTKLNLPNDPDFYKVTTCLTHYAKGIGYAALGFHDKALSHQKMFLVAKKRISESHVFGTNLAIDVISVAEKLLAGEVSYHHGDYKIAFDHLREAVKRDDNLNYSEPWDWMHPTRHALGALLLAQGHVEEATRVYQEDLGLVKDDTISRGRQNLNNIWSLHGYHECLVKSGQIDEAAQIAKQLAAAQKLADFTITSSCCCRK